MTNYEDYNFIAEDAGAEQNENYANILGMPRFVRNAMSNESSLPIDSEIDEDSGCHEFEEQLTYTEKVKQAVHCFNNASTPKKVAAGGTGLFAGWVIGGFIKRVGKTTAIALGGAFITLHIATRNGYIQVDWDKVRQDRAKIQRMSRDFQRSFARNHHQLQRLMCSAHKAATHNTVLVTTFAVGMLYAIY